MKRQIVLLVSLGALFTGFAGYAASETSRHASSPRSRALEELAEELQARERSIERREMSVTDREHELRAIEDRLAERVTQLEALRVEIDGLREQVDEERATRVNTVARSVETMKPPQAARMIAELEEELAIDVLRKMNKSKVGKLLGAMEPARAARLTEGLAGTRTPRPPTPTPTTPTPTPDPAAAPPAPPPGQ